MDSLTEFEGMYRNAIECLNKIIWEIDRSINQIYVDEAKDGLKSIKKQVENLKEEIEEQETYL